VSLGRTPEPIYDRALAEFDAGAVVTMIPARDQGEPAVYLHMDYDKSKADSYEHPSPLVRAVFHIAYVHHVRHMLRREVNFV
jgi:hypothetical protein